MEQDLSGKPSAALGGEGGAQPKKRRSRLRIVLLAVALLLALGAGATALYLGDFYHADSTAQAVLAQDASSGVVLQQPADNLVAFVPEALADAGASSSASEDTVGIIFYPGGKVEASAYAPLMRECAKRGMVAVLVQMPCNIAFLGADSAGAVPALYPQVKHWYMAGHSLGGVAACSYAVEHPEGVDGLIMLASYGLGEVPASLPVLSIYGSNDGVMSAEKYAEFKGNLASCNELVIQGGNHAQFGSYGAQDGDNPATISPEEQWAQTADAIADFTRE